MTSPKLLAALVLGVGLLLPGAVSAAAAADDSSAGSQDQVTFGGNVDVPAGQTRDGDVVAFGGNILIDGTVTRDVVAIGGSIVINGTVDRDVASVGGSVTLGPHAVVGRNIALAGGSLNRAPGASVVGSVTRGRSFDFSGLPSVGFRHFNPFFDFGSLVFGIVTAIGIIVLSLVILLFFPRQLQTTMTVLEARPLESFGLGCAGAIAGIVLMILLIITIILPFVVASAMTVAWLFGWAAIFLLIGQRLLRTMNQPQELVPALLLGGVLASIVANIPLLNWIVVLIGGSFALGAAILSRFGTQGPGAPLVPGVTQPPAAPTTA